MKLLYLFLLALTILFAVSVANAQSKISASSEYEAIHKGSNPVRVVDELELEYEVEEGGLLVASRTAFVEFGCNSYCTMEIFYLPGAFSFDGISFPGEPWEADSYHGIGNAFITYAWDGDETCPDELHWEVDLSVSLFDYKNVGFFDLLLFGPETYCPWNSEVELEVFP